MLRTDEAERKRAVILLVDDDSGDRELTRRALEEAILRADLRVASDGQDALNYLLRHSEYADPQTSPRPDLILLDLNMPRVNGGQVLERLRECPELNRIPVVVLSTSSQEEDILQSYDLGCNSFISKPVDIGKFIHVARELGHYWFELVALPRVAETPLTCND